MAYVRINRLDGGWRTRFQERVLGTIGDSTIRRHVNEIILEEIEPYVPMGGMNEEQEENDPDPHVGLLRESGHAGPTLIEWSVPYARYLWAGEVYGPNYFRPLVRKATGGYDRNGPWWFRTPKGFTKYPTGKPLTFHYPGTGPNWYALMMEQKGRRVNLRISRYLSRQMNRRQR